VDPARVTGSVTVRCPLPSHGHVDRSPSLRLHLDDDIFFCFGCGAKGDVVEWVCRTEGVGWREAIDLLDSGRPLTNAWAGQTPRGAGRLKGGPTNSQPATEARIGTETPDPARTPPERVYAALEAAWCYYTIPPLRSRGRDYLRQRGIDAGVLEAHTGRAEVGHTPARADGLVTALRSRGFSDDELVDAALGQHHRGGGALGALGTLCDFYRQRVLLPIRDDQSRIVGFVGRNIGDQQRYPKYKNPPRTAVYDKSVDLYQPLPAPKDPAGQVVVVEGTLDAMAIAVAAIRSGQADRFCPVTQSGKELSAVQLARVIDMHPGTPVLGFDGDRAGQDSAYRHALAAGRHGRAVAVTVLPGDHDPASWLAQCGDHGLAAWSVDRYEGDDLPEEDLPEPIPGDSFLAGAGTSTALLAGRSVNAWQRRTASRQQALSTIALSRGLEL
jgi:DNA primase